jgi:hypothetical protein
VTDSERRQECATTSGKSLGKATGSKVTELYTADHKIGR